MIQAAHPVYVKPLPVFPPVPCTPVPCTNCGFVYHWAGALKDVRRLAPVSQGLCPACWTGRQPVVNSRPCPRCTPPKRDAGVNS